MNGAHSLVVQVYPNQRKLWWWRRGWTTPFQRGQMESDGSAHRILFPWRSPLWELQSKHITDVTDFNCDARTEAQIGLLLLSLLRRCWPIAQIKYLRKPIFTQIIPCRKRYIRLGLTGLISPGSISLFNPGGIGDKRTTGLGCEYWLSGVPSANDVRGDLSDFLAEIKSRLTDRLALLFLQCEDNLRSIISYSRKDVILEDLLCWSVSDGGVETLIWGDCQAVSAAVIAHMAASYCR